MGQFALELTFAFCVRRGLKIDRKGAGVLISSLFLSSKHNMLYASFLMFVSCKYELAAFRALSV